jgi:hypothetical protein
MKSKQIKNMEKRGGVGQVPSTPKPRVTPSGQVASTHSTPVVLHQTLAMCHPGLTRGQVWCRKCGATRKVDSADCLQNGWPKCCGETMTIDSPTEQNRK